jgi:hypothetical protein
MNPDKYLWQYDYAIDILNRDIVKLKYDYEKLRNGLFFENVYFIEDVNYVDECIDLMVNYQHNLEGFLPVLKAFQKSLNDCSEDLINNSIENILSFMKQLIEWEKRVLSKVPSEGLQIVKENFKGASDTMFYSLLELPISLEKFSFESREIYPNISTFKHQVNDLTNPNIGQILVNLKKYFQK